MEVSKLLLFDMCVKILIKLVFHYPNLIIRRTNSETTCVEKQVNPGIEIILNGWSATICFSIATSFPLSAASPRAQFEIVL
jgi:hypothetical protein